MNVQVQEMSLSEFQVSVVTLASGLAGVTQEVAVGSLPPF